MTLAGGMVQISNLLCSLVKNTLIQSLISCIFSSLCEYDTTLPCLEVNEIPPSMTWISKFFLWVKAILVSVSNLAPLLTVTWNSKWSELGLISALFVMICWSPAPLESLMMWTNALSYDDVSLLLPWQCWCVMGICCLCCHATLVCRQRICRHFDCYCFDKGLCWVSRKTTLHTDKSYINISMSFTIMIVLTIPVSSHISWGKGTKTLKVLGAGEPRRPDNTCQIVWHRLQNHGQIDQNGKIHQPFKALPCCTSSSSYQMHQWQQNQSLECFDMHHFTMVNTLPTCKQASAGHQQRWYFSWWYSLDRHLVWM